MPKQIIKILSEQNIYFAFTIYSDCKVIQMLPICTTILQIFNFGWLKTIKDLVGLTSLRPSLKTLGLTFSEDSVVFQSVWLGHVGAKPPPVIRYILEGLEIRLWGSNRTLSCLEKTESPSATSAAKWAV